MSSSVSTWWRDSVVYQVYVRSFADGNGGGQGDINGLRSRLGHLASLGVDAIWLNPWYLSPLADGGYDVADYRQIEPRYGTLEDAEALISECHELGIRVIADLVPNHTSREHAWFKEALLSPPGHPSRDRYIFRPGRGDGSEPPSNWQAVFGGSTWEQVDDGEFYLHIFDTSQPDLNWENPEVRDEFDAIIRFWLDRGIDGLRIDVSHGMIKDLDFPDLSPEVLGSFSLLEGVEPAIHPFWDRDGVHEINRRWRAILDEYDDRMMVAEAWVHAKRLPLYLRPDEYHQAFNFDLLETPWQATAFQTVITDSLHAANAIGATTTWVLSNHDVMRHATRYALPDDVNWRRWPLDGPHDVIDQAAGDRRARAAVLISLSLPGSTYIYQGEELGLPEVWDLPTDVLDDPTWERSAHTEKGRDGCRVPLPWATDGPSFGFGEGDPWLPQPAVFGELAAQAQADDPDSMLALYRATITARKQDFTDGDTLTMIDLGPDVLAYQRAGILVIVNMSADAVTLPDGDVVLTSAKEPLSGSLPTDTAVWLRRS
jgi:alpha-glucosidase